MMVRDVDPYLIIEQLINERREKIGLKSEDVIQKSYYRTTGEHENLINANIHPTIERYGLPPYTIEHKMVSKTDRTV